MKSSVDAKVRVQVNDLAEESVLSLAAKPEINQVLEKVDNQVCEQVNGVFDQVYFRISTQVRFDSPKQEM